MNSEISLKDIYNAINDFREEVRGTYATKEELAPVKAMAYGLVGTIMTAVLAAVLAGVIRAQ